MTMPSHEVLRSALRILEEVAPYSNDSGDRERLNSLLHGHVSVTSDHIVSIGLNIEQTAVNYITALIDDRQYQLAAVELERLRVASDPF